MTATSRRAALGGTIAGIIAGTVAAPAIAAGSPDANLIALCSQLNALEGEISNLFSRRNTIADEEATEPEMEALYARRDMLMAQLDKVAPPRTMRGIVAVAQAALATHYHRDADGAAIASDDSEWLLLVACEALTGNA
jgi:hypothetical protein